MERISFFLALVFASSSFASQEFPVSLLPILSCAQVLNKTPIPHALSLEPLVGPYKVIRGLPQWSAFEQFSEIDWDDEEDPADVLEAMGLTRNLIDRILEVYAMIPRDQRRGSIYEVIEIARNLMRSERPDVQEALHEMKRHFSKSVRWTDGGGGMVLVPQAEISEDRFVHQQVSIFGRDLRYIPTPAAGKVVDFFDVDVRALYELKTLDVLRGSDRINDSRPDWVFQKALKQMKASMGRSVWGLKPEQGVVLIRFVVRDGRVDEHIGAVLEQLAEDLVDAHSEEMQNSGVRGLMIEAIGADGHARNVSVVHESADPQILTRLFGFDRVTR